MLQCCGVDFNEKAAHIEIMLNLPFMNIDSWQIKLNYDPAKAEYCEKSGFENRLVLSGVDCHWQQTLTG